jgi:hypothetical protein
MKHFATEEKLVKVCKKMECDRCKRIDDDIMQIQEYFSYRQHVGYMGILGDGNIVELDLCQYCFKDLFKDILRRTDNYISGGPWTPPDDFMEENR